MKYKIGFMMFLFLICSCDNHDFVFCEKEQVFYIRNLLHFSIEPLDSLKGACTYDIFLLKKKPYNEVDTLHLKKRIPQIFEVVESSPITQEFRHNPSYIRLLPNTRYIVKHDGLGIKVNIIKYYHTNSFGKLYPED